MHIFLTLLQALGNLFSFYAPIPFVCIYNSHSMYLYFLFIRAPYDLHAAHKASQLMTSLPPTIPWVPLDPSAPYRSNRWRGCVPLTFPPSPQNFKHRKSHHISFALVFKVCLRGWVCMIKVLLEHDPLNKFVLESHFNTCTCTFLPSPLNVSASIRLISFNCYK